MYRDQRAVVWPLSGTGQDLAQLLDAAANTASNACNGSANEIHDKYLRWGSDQIRMLQSLFSPADLSRFVTTPRYWASVGIPGAVDSNSSWSAPSP